MYFNFCRTKYLLYYIYEGILKSFRPSLQPTRNSRQAAVGQGLGQEPVSPPHQFKYLFVAAHGSMDISVAQSVDPWAANLHQCGGDTSPCPGPYPTAACLEFEVGCRLDRELFSLPSCFTNMNVVHCIFLNVEMLFKIVQRNLSSMDNTITFFL